MPLHIPKYRYTLCCFVYIAGVVLSRKFLTYDYDNTKALIENVFQEMDENVLSVANLRITFFEDETLLITKGIPALHNIFPLVAL